MLDIAIQMVILFSIVAVGYVAKRVRIMDAELDRKLSKLILSTALPAMILGSVLGADELPPLGSILMAFGLACLCYLVLIAVALVAVAALRVHPGHRGVFRFECHELLLDEALSLMGARRSWGAASRLFCWPWLSSSSGPSSPRSMGAAGS